MDERLAVVDRLHHRAVFYGELDGLDEADRELEKATAAILVARAKVAQARGDDQLELLERAAESYRGLGDKDGEAEAACWQGIVHQVNRNDDATAIPFLRRGATSTDPLVRANAERHLGIAAHKAGDLGQARAHLEESTRLRRAANHPNGAAANMVGLVYIAIAEARYDDAADLLDEAKGMADGAPVREHLDAAQEQLSGIERE